MRLSFGVIFALILVWSGIFSFIFVVYRMMLLQDPRKHAVELFDIEVIASNATLFGNEVIPSPTANSELSTAITSSVSNEWRKYAYVTLLHGIDDTYSYRGFLYNCFIVKRALVAQRSNADFIVLVGFTYGEDPKVDKISKDLALLQKFGIILHYLPRLDSNTTALVNEESSAAAQNVKARSKPGHGKKIPFLEMALLKIIPWSFTQYERVQFFDGDVLPHRNMDCFFQLGRNTFNTGNASPLNSGWFTALPNATDFAALRERAIRRMRGKKWDEKKGWGTPIPPDLLFRGGKRAVGKWSFNGASLDQGLLTDYFVLHEGRIQLIDMDSSPVPVQVYSAGYQHRGSTVGEALQVCGALATALPTEYFYHYTGKGKPWLQDLTHPRDKAQRLWAEHLDALKLSVNSSTIGKQALNSPLGYFYPNK